jgi:hypothetical protein
MTWTNPVRLLIGFAVLLLGSPGFGQQQKVEPFSQPVKWEPLFQGIQHAELNAKQPRLMRGHAAKIDLTAPGIAFTTTAPFPDKPNRTAGLKTSNFLLKSGCQLAINGSAFAPVRAEEGLEQEVVGLQVTAGKVISKGNEKFDALLINKSNKVWVSAPPFDLKDVHHGIGGFQIVLKKGEIPAKMPDYNKGLIHPRTAAGISADGKTLILLVIDGRQDNWSQGASIAEVGQWLKALGAADGINLDGGGTTTMVVAEGAKAKILNQPIHANKPGMERVAGSHIGVFAKPLPEKN